MINDFTLQIMIILICGLAMWSRNAAAMVYAFLILAHDQLFHSYSSYIWAYSAGIFSFTSILGCLYYRNGLYDDTAYFLAWISAITLCVNIFTIYKLFNLSPTEGLNPVFAAVNAASIVAIVAGGRRDRRRRNIYRNTLAYRLVNQRRRMADSMALHEEIKP